ncbi:PEP-CTERM sorting domain-containing protein [Alkalimonas sp. MEB108]|uniref:PEP-CTERM sorting domain-containing protein n=1 Tax=Alkalimonas cellulosilytica TaxID=3058395 RepID=A0ABU7J6W9_9GAMM|nr:PEP-CTERM sorting domain-containing protein [Alkalimonas sp. MEB108]MEE2001762.1 PEP-CTERM sorting domain-containing protein [Alkalimonas sp. MEB108]
MKKFHGRTLGLAFATLFAGSALASPIITFTDGVSYTTDSLTGFTTNGSQMHGMSITTCFITGACEEIIWDGTVGMASYGEARSSNWLLSVNGDTFGNPFTFETLNGDTAITSISINGRPGNTVFDVILDPVLSPGSARGNPFTLFGSNPDLANYTVNVNYTDRLAIGGVFYGDLYTVMNIDFGGQGFTGSFRFITDTDNNDFAGGSPIVPVDPNPVPLPGTLFLFVAGLAGLGLRRKLRK